MPGEAYFITLAGLGLTLAGFAGLITAVDARPVAHTPARAWRIRNIVLDGTTLLIASIGVLAFYAVTDGNVRVAVMVSGLIVAARLVGVLLPSNLTGPAWEGVSQQQVRATAAFTVVGMLAALWVAFVGEIKWLQLLLFVQLWPPFSIFYNTIRDVAEGTDDEADATAASDSE